MGNCTIRQLLCLVLITTVLLLEERKTSALSFYGTCLYSWNVNCKASNRLLHPASSWVSSPPPLLLRRRSSLLQSQRRDVVNPEQQRTTTTAVVTRSAAATTITTPQEERPSHTCRVCDQSFASRNALFRHLQNTTGYCTCSQLYNRINTTNFTGDSTSISSSSATTTETFRIAFRFGYFTNTTTTTTGRRRRNIRHVHSDQNNDQTQETQVQNNTAERAATCIIQRIEDMSNQYHLHNTNVTTTVNASVAVSSTTQSSCAKLRPVCLQQEEDCAAAGDVLVIAGEITTNTTTTNSSFGRKKPVLVFTKIDSLIRSMFLNHESMLIVDQDLHVRLDAYKRLVEDDGPPHQRRRQLLHAERSCTQYIYHYLLPLSWLEDDGDSDSDSVSVDQWVKVKREQGGSGIARPPALVRLKKALRSAENPRLNPTDLVMNSTSSISDSTTSWMSSPSPQSPISQQQQSHRYRRRRDRRDRAAAGRFGGLAFKNRRPWHNFCDPSLRGQASPNNEPVWRCVDRARIIQFLVNENNSSCSISQDSAIITTTSNSTATDAMAIIEFRGDAFLKHQIRHIVGTAVAMANQWLPMDDTFAKCTSPDRIVAPLPCAPAGRLYLAGTRFHFEELALPGRKSLFESNVGGPVTSFHPDDGAHHHTTNVMWIQHALLSQKSVEELRLEQDWLDDLKQRVCPATLASLQDDDEEEQQQQQPGDSNDPSKESELDALRKWRTTRVNMAAPPEEYKNVLDQLRAIVAQEKWPETSAARSSVIRGFDNVGRLPIIPTNKGSFTVLNPLVELDGSYPQGNELFPELVKEVFALEQKLSKQARDRVTINKNSNGEEEGRMIPRRPPSSHCAINCNAAFTPHVDSGKGNGQSISMIVGLGDYVGGELMVEGESYDIRFRPLEFDGWKLRHWTRRFTGERFSLVWFTPARKGGARQL